MKARSFCSYALFSMAMMARLHAANPPDEKFLTGISTPSGAYEYWIPWESLPGKTAWDPLTEPFPMGLHSQASAASRYISLRNGLTKPLALCEIEARRLSISPQSIQVHGKDPMEFTNRWFLRFTYELVHGASDFRVVMLLDGAYATEKKDGTYATEKKVEARLGALEPQKTALRALDSGATDQPRTNAVWSVEFNSVSEGPMREVLTTNFVPSIIQWDPMLSDFTLELSECTAQARAHLITATNMPDDFILQELSIQRYIPVDALRSRGEDIEKHLHHFVIVFVFGQPTSPFNGKEYSAYILLDKRIVATNVRPWGGWQPAKRPVGDAGR